MADKTTGGYSPKPSQSSRGKPPTTAVDVKEGEVRFDALGDELPMSVYEELDWTKERLVAAETALSEFFAACDHAKAVLAASNPSTAWRS